RLAHPQSSAPGANTTETVSPTLRQLLNHQGLFPAFILGRRWDILAWNQTASLLLGDLDSLQPEDRNQLWHIFTNPHVRHCLTDWESQAQRMLAEFRDSYGRYFDDEQFTVLLDRLTAASDEFRAWWPRHDVVGRHVICKEFHLPDVGRLVFEQITTYVGDSTDLRLVVKVPLPESDTMDKLLAMTQADLDAIPET